MLLPISGPAKAQRDDKRKQKALKSSLVRDLIAMHTDEPEEIKYGVERSKEDEYEEEKQAYEEGYLSLPNSTNKREREKDRKKEREREREREREICCLVLSHYRLHDTSGRDEEGQANPKEEDAATK